MTINRASARPIRSSSERIEAAVAWQSQRTVPIPYGIVIVDTETTGLDPATALVVEVAWAHGDGPIEAFVPDHPRLDLVDVSPEALAINGYHARGLATASRATAKQIRALIDAFAGTDGPRHLAGANPRFDMAMLPSVLRCEPWHYRPVSIPDRVAGLVSRARDNGATPSMASTAALLQDLGFIIPSPDHTAGGDVAAERECLRAAIALRLAYGLPEVD
jgi:hypothetical protein